MQALSQRLSKDCLEPSSNNETARSVGRREALGVEVEGTVHCEAHCVAASWRSDGNEYGETVRW